MSLIWDITCLTLVYIGALINLEVNLIDRSKLALTINVLTIYFSC